jgi:transposase
MRYVGLDVHWKQSTLCVLDERGRKVLTRTIRGRWSEVLAELAKVRRPFSICFEASTGYGYLYDGLRRMARRVVVAHAGQLRLIFRSKRKNDRVDAEKLAKLLFLDEVPVVHVPSSDVRSWRRLINHRRKLVGERARVKNSIRAMLRSQGIQTPRGLWGRHDLDWLQTAELSTELDALQRDVLVERLRTSTVMIDRVEEELNRVASCLGVDPQIGAGAVVLRAS